VSLVTGIIALVGVSLLTEPEPPDRIHDLFERLHTSSDTPAATSTTEPSVARQPLFLVNLLRLRDAAGTEGWRAYREDLGGFAAGWLIVLTVVIATAIMLKM
jgi:hypothetical protein